VPERYFPIIYPSATEYSVPFVPFDPWCEKNHWLPKATQTWPGRYYPGASLHRKSCKSFNPINHDSDKQSVDSIIRLLFSKQQPLLFLEYQINKRVAVLGLQTQEISQKE
jgi:hypothetical protein